MGNNKKKLKIRSRGSPGGHMTQFLEFWDPLRISGTVEATNSKFGMKMDPVGN